MENEVDLEELGVKAVNVQEYETSYEDKVDKALRERNAALEWKRLDRVRESIQDLQIRIDNASTKVPLARLAKLMDRLDELKEEERQIIARIEEVSNVIHSDSKIKEPIEQTSEKEPIVTQANFTFPIKKPVERKRLRGEEDVEILSSDSEVEGITGNGNGEEEAFYDDGNEDYYKSRLKNWLLSLEEGGDDLQGYLDVVDLPLEKQCHNLSFPRLVDTGVSGYKIASSVHERLLDYQHIGVDWMLDLHRQALGGILGDEMGLGKTIQAISFIAALHCSQKLTHPVLILCPATVMKQWVKEFHSWWPLLRIVLLHSSGYLGDNLDSAFKSVTKRGHVIISSYGHLQQRHLGRRILDTTYSAVILDEGHKIRNHMAEITALCKQLQTPHRYILSGTPIQNNLMELWSLMDFIYPGRLGTMNVFKTELSLPINAGGYVNASSLQVQTSYRCACILKDLITPYLMRRVKADVAQSLPSKQEQVLFCQLTEYQRSLYEHYISSEDVRAILSKEKNILAGIDILRKICNHPALLKMDEEEIFGLTEIAPPKDDTEKSGKLNVLKTILKHWHQHGHRVLLFCQTRQMLNIIEGFVISLRYPYLRMDGTTPISSRMALVDKFNDSSCEELFIFLLTTKVGGLGVNLTGADRVIIFDPDWNPSTDMQARERAWRLGQTKPVTIYRMLTVGTIEEKIYHRQIFKQYLTNRILADPKQTRFFKSSDLYDLFSLSSPDGPSDTGLLLSGLEEKQDKTDVKSEGSSLDMGKNIMDGLLSITGLHSSLEHDRLVEKPKSEVYLVEREAKKRAEEAVAALRRSQVTIPVQGLCAGFTASAILASIRKRQAAAVTDDIQAINGTNSLLERIVDQLINLFRHNNGHCSSAMVASTFSYVSGDDAVALRQVLKTMAVFQKDARLWSIRREFL